MSTKQLIYFGPCSNDGVTSFIMSASVPQALADPLSTDTPPYVDYAETKDDWHSGDSVKLKRGLWAVKYSVKFAPWTGDTQGFHVYTQQFSAFVGEPGSVDINGLQYSAVTWPCKSPSSTVFANYIPGSYFLYGMPYIPNNPVNDPTPEFRTCHTTFTMDLGCPSCTQTVEVYLHIGAASQIYQANAYGFTVTAQGSIIG